MPYYDFQNDKTGEIKSLFFHMNDDKIFIDETGFQWRRLFSIPQAAIDTVLDPFNPADFNKKTSKPGTMGELFDRSKEMSEKRKDKDGIDVVENKYWQDWSKTRKGRKPPKQVFDI
jgi:hypothetical protein